MSSPKRVKAYRTRSQRRLTWTRSLGYKLIAWLGVLVVELEWRASRLTVVGEAALQELIAKHGAVVVAFWHQHLLICSRFMVSDRAGGMKPGFMISPSVDGQAPTLLALHYGAHVIRGSGSYTGLRAVRGAHQAIVRDKISPGITPDGPRGPRFVFKPGAIYAAQLSGVPVVPIAYAARRARVLKSWDKFVIPWLFARVVVAIGEPFYPPAQATDEELQAMQELMARRLHETYQKAARTLEGSG